MTRTLVFKLTAAIWLVSLIGVTLVALFAFRATTNEFGTLQKDRIQRSLVDQLASYYAATGSWEGADVVLQRLSQETQTPFAIADSEQNIVLPGPGFPMNRGVPSRIIESGVSIEVDGNIVGTLIVPEFNARDPFRGGRAPINPETAFLQRINRAVLLAAIGATAVSLIIGFLLARTLTRPIQALTQATQRVAAGDLGHRVEVEAQDELGNLADSFNKMSADLAASRNQRRQLTADIAHDLRTPLSLILGHAEALSDGVLPPTTQTFSIIHDEAQRLNRLIEDLRTLSLAETGELAMVKREVFPKMLIDRAATAYAPAAKEKSITIQTHADELPTILADPDRINQVFDNLMQNGVRHTPAGGIIALAAMAVDDMVQLTVRDSGAGIPSEDLPHIFSRFYRADKSRHRQSGGSGLGLAIARSIVEQHNGRIWAESTPGSGTSIHFTLPLYAEKVNS